MMLTPAILELGTQSEATSALAHRINSTTRDRRQSYATGSGILQRSRSNSNQRWKSWASTATSKGSASLCSSFSVDLL
jgi:hypothetical protein